MLTAITNKQSIPIILRTREAWVLDFRYLLIVFWLVIGLLMGRPAMAQDATHVLSYSDPQYAWENPPEQAQAQEGFLDVNGAKIWYWDTGGAGEAVVFSHPASGSGLTWEYQQPVLVDAGYRVIGYSRRGAFQSDVTDDQTEISASDDLMTLLDYLAIDKFHIVAIAAGGNVAPDLADRYPDRVLSLAVGCTIGRTDDESYASSNATLMPDEFSQLPTYVKELSPFYRGANPQAWIDIYEKSQAGTRVGLNLRRMTTEILASISQPVLLFTGDADFYMPPSRLRAYSQYWTNPEVVVFRGAGHAPHWEQPIAFNETLLNFLQRNGQ